ncbi:MAG: hypothetical protein KKC68_07175 [Candidatus Thermoplasmatota archaeon]|nr:hypothetical protein [Candidatus Thermoplasmatota archaeon]MBU1941542.1 hypothetical protein [Candidatus Thermoplasmatota archaeon]
MNIRDKKIISSILLIFLGITSMTTVIASHQSSIIGDEDFDPLVDIAVTVEIDTIRSLEKQDKQLHKKEFIDILTAPDFYGKISINNEESISPVWDNTKYLYDMGWTATVDVPDTEEFVEIKIQLWDARDELFSADRLCDVSPDGGIGDDSYDVELIYSIRDGHWTGDDSLQDASGYGRLNGCDDGTIYTRNRDCELWFNIYQTDYDNDMIPYWIEVNQYGTDPMISNLGMDVDNDNIPIEWEWKWGYDPMIYNSHNSLDSDVDGLNNYEEYLVSEWKSDPYRIDIYTELDQMSEGPNGEINLLPEGSKELLFTAFDRQNVVFHLDDGCMGGGEMIPYDEECNRDDLQDIYNDYFYHGSTTWRRGVFHYGIVIHGHTDVAGAVFGDNRFYITSRGHDKKADQLLLNRDEVYASAYMHELGHTLDFSPIPGHSRDAMYPWQIMWWVYRPYRSCMNYGYMYYTVDYSDGSNPSSLDYNDWERMDLRAFQHQ